MSNKQSPQRQDGTIEPKVRWLTGAKYLDLNELAQSPAFRKKVAQAAELERAIREASSPRVD